MDLPVRVGLQLGYVVVDQLLVVCYHQYLQTGRPQAGMLSGPAPWVGELFGLFEGSQAGRVEGGRVSGGV